MSKYLVGQTFMDREGDYVRVTSPGKMVLWHTEIHEWDDCELDISNYEMDWGPLISVDGVAWRDTLLAKHGEEAREYLKGLEDPISHPEHYTSHPSGVECIDITRHMGFLDGNVLKYLWRYSMKGGVEDLKKARQYLDWLIEKEEMG